MIYSYAIKNSNENLTVKIENCEIIDANELYKGYKFNEHHWTTNFVWSVFIPKLLADMELPFNLADWKQIKNVSENGQFDLSYHIPVNDTEIEFNDLSTGKKQTIKISELRAKPNESLACPGMSVTTEYHRLFRGCHRVCELKNKNAITDRILIINCDSMSVPVIPILCYYFKEILILDNRANMSFRKIIRDYFSKATDLLNLMLASWFNKGKNKTNLK